MKPTVTNRKARHDYFILETLEAGISLLGHEVKSIREGRVNLGESYVRVMRGEAFLVNCHIAPYSKIQGHLDIDPIRTRKLLIKKAQIVSLMGKSGRKGYAMVPLSMYFNKRGKIKVEIALGKGKKHYDKRETIKRRIHDRETAQAVKLHSRGRR